MAGLPKYVKDAIKCGDMPKIRKWQTLPAHKLTDGEKVLRFSKDHLVFPEGKMIGKPLELDLFQQAFILAVFDSKLHVRKAILSMARRNGKTLIMAVILLAYIVGPLAKANTMVRSGAMTRDQAALLWRFMDLICTMSPDLEGLYSSVPSSKTLKGLSKNVEYKALSRDAKAGHGQGIYILVLDEAGQIDSEHDDFLDMLFSSMGTYEDSRTFIISTQAPSDAAFLSQEIDSAERDQPSGVVSHVYAAVSDEILDSKNWHAANPGLRGGYRSLTDVQKQAADAMAIPAKSNGFLNLFMNRRVSMESAWLSAQVWKQNNAKPDWNVFKKNGCVIGLDLSIRSDWTCACLAAKDDEDNIHLWPFTFIPLIGVAEKEKRDRMPYSQWVRDGHMIGIPGEAIDYEYVASFLKEHVENAGIEIQAIDFDDFKADEFFAACDRVHFAQYADRHKVYQSAKSMHPRVEEFEVALIQKRIRHGSQPTLNAGAAVAVIIEDANRNRKIVKNRALSHQKIDSLLAAVMAAYPLLANKLEESIYNDEGRSLIM